MRRIGVILFSAVILTLGLVAPNAALAVDRPTVNWANSDPDDLGTLEVSVTSPQAITHLTAHLVDPSTGAEVGVTDDFVLRSGTATDGVWATRETFKLAQLGYYPVNVDATAADGTQVTADAIGHLTYYAQTIFDPLTTSRKAVDYAHRDIVVRGRVLSRSPGTREVTPFAGAPLYLNWRETGRNGNDDIDWAELTTNANGRFSYARTVGGTDEFSADFPYQNEFPGHLSGTSANLLIPVKQSPVRLTAAVTPRRVNAGGAITVSGQATWKSPTGWQPLAGAHFIVGQYYPGWAQVDTDADGRYSATFVPYQSTDIPVTYLVTDPFVADATATTKVVVAQPSVIRDFSAQRGVPGTIEVSGVIDFPGAGSPGDPAVDIEFSADGTGWVRKATLHPTSNFSGTITAQRPGYWRAHYRGGREFQPSISEAMYADPR